MLSTQIRLFMNDYIELTTEDCITGHDVLLGIDIIIGANEVTTKDILGFCVAMPVKIINKRLSEFTVKRLMSQKKNKDYEDAKEIITMTPNKKE
ncbi:hypothetical protein NLN80_22890 [Citrobacter portucalensis]|uniref:hypothetical protein n=2 Tax=Citrobacter portucalensis TaxID=1639133 RepID=UPI00226B0233|nr:hypothetical protein [Citrobacter portucalensis]MCX9009450.1 hypothetical protein [Citrobacter portucalensis]